MSKTGRGSDQYMMRFPDGMRDAVIDLANKTGRSLNSEIIVALEKHLASSGVELPAQPRPYNGRLDMFVAAALSGLLARGGTATTPLDALSIGRQMLKTMEAEQ